METTLALMAAPQARSGNSLCNPFRTRCVSKTVFLRGFGLVDPFPATAFR